MSGIFSGGPQSETKRPSYTRPGGDFLGGGKLPYGFTDPSQLQQLGGYWPDVGAAGQMFPYQNIYGGIQQGYPNVQAGGNYFAGLGLGGTQQGMGATNFLADQSLGNARWATGVLPQTQNTLGLQMPALDVANYYAQGIQPGISGANMGGGTGAGQQVMNAGLGFGADLADIQKRAIAEGLPDVRASYSARGLGTSGGAARGEQDYIQRISDQMAQEAIQARLGGLGIAAQGANTAANEAANFGNIGLGRGNLALQATQVPQNVLNQMLQGQGLALSNFGQVGGLFNQAGQQQFQPLQLAGLGAGVWGQGMQFPLDYANTLYGATRQPYNWLSNFINGVPNVGNSGQKEGFLGIG